MSHPPVASDLDFLHGDVVAAAPRLLGCELRFIQDGQEITGRIVETEAYHQTDAASHSYRGRTPRTDIMFGPPGYLYVYFTYGMHYCMNVVTGPAGEGSAVLIRAVEPLIGIPVMRRNRGGVPDGQLTNGPAKTCQAFGIDRRYNGADLGHGDIRLIVRPPVPESAIVTATRVGISKDTDRPWRFYMRDNPYVSKLA